MDPRSLVESAVAGLLSARARDVLASIDLPAIDPGSLREYLARLRFVAPMYLPFATYDGSPLGIHLWPGRPLSTSPIYYVPSDEQGATFVCASQADLPVGLWLWVAQYFKDRQDQLRAALEALQAEIPGGRAVPDELWRILLQAAPEYEPSWWSPGGSEATQRAWRAAKVGHPFVDVPPLDDVEEPERAIAILQPYVDAHPDAAPEIVSALLAAQAQLGTAMDRAMALRVLSAEAERAGQTVFWGPWREYSEGLAEWDVVLRNLPDRRSMLHGTPFALLADAPETYSSRDPGGVARLVAVSEGFRDAGDAAGELRQLRNAAWLAALSDGVVPSELCVRIADSADRLEKDSPAGALARACAITPTSAA